MIVYQTLLNSAQAARAKAQMQLSELRLAASNLLNEIEHQTQTPEGCISVAQSKPDGEPRVVDRANLTYTEEHTIAFHIRVRLDGSRGTVATLAVPVSISRTAMGILTIVEESDPHVYQVGNNANVVQLIANSLARQADEVGV
jgi:1-aminocyclopropane-1-carboxylate deaminase/D-cysteine desulfhydrase-like pyridoxal-dependent ACC family enzyme